MRSLGKTQLTVYVGASIAKARLCTQVRNTKWARYSVLDFLIIILGYLQCDLFQFGGCCILQGLLNNLCDRW